MPGAGGVLVAINTRLTADEIGYILEHSGASFLFVDPRWRTSCDGAAVERVLVRATPAIYEEFLASAAGRRPEDGLEDEEDTIASTTPAARPGRPKGVMYTHRGAYLNALGEVVHAPAAARASVYLWTLPMFHCNGWCFTWAVTAVGGTHVCLRQVDPAASGA